MKRILTFFLALTMVLSLAACGGKADDNKGKTEVTMTAQEIMDTLKEKLGDSFGCDVAETEDNISGYWGLDMGQVESWASMSNSNSAVNSSYAVIVKVKEGYAQDAAALLQTGYELPDVQHGFAEGLAGSFVRERQLCGAADPRCAG